MKEGQAIETTISLRRAGERLGIDPKEVKGAARALGITLHADGTSLRMEREDFERLSRRLGKPGPVTSAAG